MSHLKDGWLTSSRHWLMLRHCVLDQNGTISDVDSLEPIDVLVVFSSLSSWRGDNGCPVGLAPKPSLGILAK